METRFCAVSGPRLQQLRAAITTCKQSKSMSIEDYYTTLMGYFDDLLRLKPSHGCECGNCSCVVLAKYELDREEEILHQFLIGIDDDKYAIVRTNLLSKQPPATLDRAYQALLQEERFRHIVQGRSQKDKMMLMFFLFLLTVGSISRCAEISPNCTPLIVSVRVTMMLGASSSMVTRIGGLKIWPQRGIFLHGSGCYCPSALATASPRLAMGFVVAPIYAHAVGGVSPSPPPDHLSTLSELQPEHVKILLNMINNQPQDKMIREYFSNAWIIDTRASHHVTGDESCLLDVTSILSCPVGLSDGTLVMATKEGRVFFTNDIILEDVLFVPQLNCNFI